MVAEQDILSFCDITGASTSVAEQFLEIADGNVETAVTLYLENGGEHSTNSSFATGQDAFTSNLAQNDAIESGEGQLLADEELARRLQGSQQVRAPIAPKRDILAGEASGISRPSVFNQGDSTTGSVANIFETTEDEAHIPAGDSFSGSVAGSSNSKAKRLADLFRPPFDIMFHGNFEQTLLKSLLFSYRFPHIAIIDSRTGERVKVWEKQLTPTNFMMEVTEFLENHSTEERGAMKRPKVTKSVSDMSEEEQLNAAIEASLSNTSSPDIESKMEEDEKMVESKTESVFDSIMPIKRDEPPNGNDTTRIQIRMGDGSRVVRRFNKSDPVRYLFEFVKLQVENQPFEVRILKNIKVNLFM
ncbi:hypothetical protein RO3G_05402 [Rhizopus delemar RA 99-880]|uniref:UBX domain-containing protein n=1 Tax=Rhizopus delemar (strain RA 99-880 / ATCC MYA-4621 / FGSC 9543 / NRRL 43880) TaxID=246409 RepID=I1BWW7_RHIO9|nr:hypothetical protein RO3G_05402 [Rhizopus delemar RA 99-880]|eukprot:EIE80697.1 hypothetical protein RO3G_05402 [Rhizopus delemar RA 99-880]